MTGAAWWLAIRGAAARLGVRVGAWLIRHCVGTNTPERDVEPSYAWVDGALCALRLAPDRSWSSLRIAEGWPELNDYIPDALTGKELEVQRELDAMLPAAFEAKRAEEREALVEHVADALHRGRDEVRAALDSLTPPAY